MTLKPLNYGIIMVEREFPPLAAREKILQSARSLQLSLSIEYSNTSKTVATCKLMDKQGSLLAEGAGKGIHAEIGAMAESLEHFALTHHYGKDLTNIAIDKIRQQPLLSMDGLIANLPETQSVIECVTLMAPRSGATAQVPAVLHLPGSPLAERIRSYKGFSFLSRYSSNSGIAFGCSEPEAILHGINEVIERHILSKVLMCLCDQHESLLMSSPSADVLDQVFFENSALRRAADGIKILIIKTIYGVYFSIAIPKRADGRHPICQIGSGCSVDARIAIQRATTELLQCTLLFDESEKAADLNTYTMLRKSERFRRLISLEILRNIEHIFRRLEPPVELSVSDQIDHITDKVLATGLQVLHRTLLNFDNGCAVTHTYIPGTERFNLIRAGMPVVPQHLLHANKSFV
jgi:ribosomal protein S12 methylthiotransferase accessory factor